MINSIINFSRAHSFYFDHVHLSPCEQIGLHKQSTWELSYIIVGSGLCRLGKETMPFGHGEVALVPPDLPHCWTFNEKNVDGDGKIENITLVFSAELFDQLSAFSEIYSSMEKLKQLQGALKVTKSFSADFRQILDKMPEQNEAQRFVGLISLLLLFAENRDKTMEYGQIDTTTDKEKRLKMIETFVNCNFKREITIDMIARHVGLNRSAFCTFFRKSKDMTFFHYLNAYRIDMACYFLSHGNCSISEACYQAGFRDVPYFNRVFKKMKNTTPGKFQKNHK